MRLARRAILSRSMVRVVLLLSLLPALAHAQAYDDPETEKVLCKLDGSCPKEPEPPATPASPDAPPPPPPVARPRASTLVLKPGEAVLTVTSEASVGSGTLLEPISIAPDFSYGLTERVTVSLVHSGFATTGFRGSAGGGICLSGESHGCVHPYNNVGAEALVELVRGDVALAAVGGVHAISIDPLFLDLKAGVQTSVRSGAITATLSPSVLIGVTERAQNEGTLFVPASIGVQATRSWFAAVGGGVATPLADAGGAWTARIGLIARYRIQRGLFVAGSIFLPKLAGGSAVDNTGVDARVANLWFTYTL